MSLTPKQRARRVCLVACHSIRNFVYFRAGWKDKNLVITGEFWTTVNGNFVDIAVTEWCKLFADQRGKHRWGAVVSDANAFLAGLLAEIGLTQADFESYIDNVRTYRNKFVAHLDDGETINIPKLDIMRASASFLYDHMRNEEDEGGWFDGFPKDSASYIEQCKREAQEIYG